MPHTTQSRSARRPLRASVLLALLLLFGLAGLRPPPVALAACGSATVVDNTAELNAAIDAFNDTSPACNFVIQIGTDIDLTADITPIINGGIGGMLTIQGSGNTLDGGDLHKLFVIEEVDVTINDLAIRDGLSDGIKINFGSLRVEDSYIYNNNSVGIDSTHAVVVVVDSAVAANTSTGIYASGPSHTLHVINTTIANNNGNGVLTSHGVVQLTHVTLIAQSLDGLVFSDSDVTVDNSILADNGGSDCAQFSGDIDLNYSLVQTNNVSLPCSITHGQDGAIVGEDPRLTAPGDHGGPTPTALPAVGSPVIDKGDNTLSKDETGATLTTDQRGAGFPRNVGGVVDMGAVEGGVAVNCPSFPITVDDEDELNNAILCFGGLATAGVYTINLGADIDLTASTYAIDNQTNNVSLLIEGNGRVIDGQGAPNVRPMNVAPNTEVTLREATITGGNVVDYGGGILNRGNLSIHQSTVTRNAADEGGGINNEHDAEITITDSTISNNWAAYGGGISNKGWMEITDSTISDNWAAYGGGGISNEGWMEITDTAIEDNTVDSTFARMGGGISNEGELILLRSTVAGNSVTFGDIAYGGGIYNEANLIVRDSTVMSNIAQSAYRAIGAGIYSEVDSQDAVEDGFGMQLIIINSTISTNSASGAGMARGGGLYAASLYCCGVLGSPIQVTLTNTTVADNSVSSATHSSGAGAYFTLYDDESDLDIEVFNSILAGNTINGTPGDDCRNTGGSTLTFTSFSSLYGDTGDGACGLAAANPDGNGNRVGVDAKLGPLADNGGPTQTHLPADDSPAVDTGADDFALDEDGNPLAADQRGYEPRVVGSAVDMGSVEVGAEGPAAQEEGVFMSATTSGTTADGLAFDNSDILLWDGDAWSLYFDGSAALLAPNNKSKHNVNAFSIGEEGIIMSFAQNARKVPGLTPKVDGTDLVRWDGSAFSFWFDGSDVGLDKKAAEKIDGLHVLPGEDAPDEYGGGCVAYLLVSTHGPGAVPAYGGGQIKFGGEDVLGFCATNLGEDTAGFWQMALDGSAEGVKRNAIDSISLSADGQTLYLTTKGTFTADSASGGHSMVYVYEFGDFSGPIFKAADNGLLKKVDGLQMN